MNYVDECNKLAKKINEDTLTEEDLTENVDFMINCQKEGRTLLGYACVLDKKRIISLIIKVLRYLPEDIVRGYLEVRGGPYNRTVLHDSYTDLFENKKELKNLLSYKPNPNLEDANRQTFFFIAANTGDTYMVEKIVGIYGPSILFQKNRNGDTVLIDIAREGEDYIIEMIDTILLLARRHHITQNLLNEKNNEGNTALIVAVKAEEYENADEIIKYSTNPTEYANIQNNNGETAISLGFSPMTRNNSDSEVGSGLSSALTSLTSLRRRLFGDQEEERNSAEPSTRSPIAKPTTIETKIIELREFISEFNLNIKLDWPQKIAFQESKGEMDTIPNGFLYSITDAEDFENNQFLQENTTSVIFMVKNSKGEYHAYGLDVRSIILDTSIYFQCDGMTPISDAPKICKISLTSQYYFYVDNLYDCLESGQRVFLVEEILPKVVIDRTMSWGAAKHILYPGVFPGELIYVSADHCQQGTNKNIHSLYICESTTGNCL